MEKKSFKSLKVLCYVALAFSAIWLVFICIQTYYVYTTGQGEGVINWSSPDLNTKLTLSIAERLSSLTMLCLGILFVLNILKSIKEGVIFARRNVTLLRAMAIILPIYTFFRDNAYSIAYTSERAGDFVLTDTPFVYLLVTLLVAQLYKIACDAAEEQQLTI